MEVAESRKKKKSDVKLDLEMNIKSSCFYF